MSYPFFKTVSTPEEMRVDVVDGLRACAIIWVVWLHVWEISWFDADIRFLGTVIPLNMFAPVGSLGVDLFFFISGFCLYLPFAKHHKPIHTKANLKAFYLRRGLKILPSYWLAMIFALLFNLNTIPSEASVARHIGLHLLFIHNWYADTLSSLFGVFWSLGVEVQFYVIFPAICFFYQRFPKLTWLSAALIAIAYRQLVVLENLNSLPAYQLPAFLDLFVTGMAVAHLFVLKQRFIEETSRLISVSTVLAIVAIGLTVGLIWSCHNTRYQPLGIPMWKVENRLSMGLVFGFLTLTLPSSTAALNAIFTNRIVLWLSAISYNLYLSHQTLGLWIAHRIPPYMTVGQQTDKLWQLQVFTLTIFSSLLWATILTYRFERPIIRRFRQSRHRFHEQAVEEPLKNRLSA